MFSVDVDPPEANSPSTSSSPNEVGTPKIYSSEIRAGEVVANSKQQVNSTEKSPSPSAQIRLENHEELSDKNEKMDIDEHIPSKSGELPADEEPKNENDESEWEIDVNADLNQPSPAGSVEENKALNSKDTSPAAQLNKPSKEQDDEFRSVDSNDDIEERQQAGKTDEDELELSEAPNANEQKRITNGDKSKSPTSSESNDDQSSKNQKNNHVDSANPTATMSTMTSDAEKENGEITVEAQPAVMSKTDGEPQGTVMDVDEPEAPKPSTGSQVSQKNGTTEADVIGLSSYPAAQLETPETTEASISKDAVIPAPAEEAEPDKELNPEEAADLVKLNTLLATVSVAVAQRGVRQHASKCLLGSTKDEAFFAETVLSRASDRAVAMVVEATQKRLLDVAKAHQQSFLDCALEIRMATIESKKLAMYLARAQRLGFEEQDEIDGEDAMPVLRPGEAMPQGAPPVFRPQWGPPPPPAGFMYNPNLPMPEMDLSQGGFKVCPSCGATFKQAAGLRYHIEREVCKKPGTPMGPVMATCEACGKEFRSPGGYHYHMTNNVCGALAPPNKTGAPTSGGATPANLAATAAIATAKPDAGHEFSKEPAKQGTETPSTASAPIQRPPLVHPGRPGSGHMFHNGPQQPYQGPYQNSLPGTSSYSRQGSPGSEQVQVARPPPPAQIVPSTPLPTPASFQGRMHLPGSHVPKPLTPEEAEKLNNDLKAEDAKYAKQIEDLPDSLQGEARVTEIKRLKAGMSTRKSNLRRKHGIFVRKTDKAAANAVRNEDGSIEIVPHGTTVSVGSGFAPINRQTPAATPAPGPAEPVVPSSAPPRTAQSPPEGAPDAKRRRVSDMPQQVHQSPYGPPPPPQGYPPNYNMHPGSYDPRFQPPYMNSPYQQYNMSPYAQAPPPPPSGYDVYHGGPGFQMNTIIRVPGAPPVGPPGQNGPQQYHRGPMPQQPQGFVSVNQPPLQRPLSAGQPDQIAGDANDQNSHGHPQGLGAAAATAISKSPGASASRETSASQGGSKIPLDAAELSWQQKQKSWPVLTGAQGPGRSREKARQDKPRPGIEEADDAKAEVNVTSSGKKKKAKKEVSNEFHVSISSDDGEATEEDESAKRPSHVADKRTMAINASEMNANLQRAQTSIGHSLAPKANGKMGAPLPPAPAPTPATAPYIRADTSDLSDIDEDVPMVGAGPVVSPYGVEDNVTAEEDGQIGAPSFPAINANGKKANGSARSASGVFAKRPVDAQKPAALRKTHAQVDDSDDTEDGGGNDFLKVASDDDIEMADIAPPKPKAKKPRAPRSSGTPQSRPSQPTTPVGSPAIDPVTGEVKKKRLGRPVGWKKGMGGYRELLDAGVVDRLPVGVTARRGYANRTSLGAETSAEVKQEKKEREGLSTRKSVGGHEGGGKYL